VQERKNADALVAFLAALKTSALAYIGALAGPDAVDMTETAALEPEPER
jgi:hypothetical protein